MPKVSVVVPDGLDTTKVVEMLKKAIRDKFGNEAVIEDGDGEVTDTSKNMPDLGNMPDDTGSQDNQIGQDRISASPEEKQWIQDEMDKEALRKKIREKELAKVESFSELIDLYADKIRDSDLPSLVRLYSEADKFNYKRQLACERLVKEGGFE